MNSQVKYIIFSDASQRRYGNRNYCGYGVAVLNSETQQYVTFGGELSPRSIVFCEAWAIYQGMIKVAELARNSKHDRPVNVLVVTDSKLNVEILTRYIPYTWNLSDWNHWKKADGSSVRNQDLYRVMLTFMKNHPEIHASITHMNSHLNDSEWPRIKKKLQSYGVRVHKETAQIFMKMNAIVDRIAQDITSQMREDEAKSGYYFRLKRCEK